MAEKTPKAEPVVVELGDATIKKLAKAIGAEFPGIMSADVTASE